MQHMCSWRSSQTVQYSGLSFKQCLGSDDGRQSHLVCSRLGRCRVTAACHSADPMGCATLRFGCGAKALAKCKLKYDRISECVPTSDTARGSYRGIHTLATGSAMPSAVRTTQLSGFSPSACLLSAPRTSSAFLPSCCRELSPKLSS